MKKLLLKYLLIGILISIINTNKVFSQVVFTALAGNAPAYLTQGNTNQVVYGFSVAVPALGTFNPGPVHIAASSSLNGFVSGNLIRTTTNNPALAISAPVASYSATINSTIDINGFPSLTGGTTGTTYYFYLVLSITTTANPSPASVIFSLPSSSSISQNGYSGGITVNNTASPMTYYFGVNPPVVPNVTICGPGTATLTASDSPAGGTYSWYTAATGGTLLQSSTAVTYSASIGATTNYYVSYTSGSKTSTRTTTTATVGTAPLSTFTATSSVAVGGNATITYTGGDPSTSTYTWNFNGGTIISGSGQGPYSIQWSTPGTKTITLSVTNAAGCTSTVSSQNVAVSPVAPTATGGSNCGTGTVLLTAAGGSPTGGTYNWYAVSSGGTALQSSTSTTYTTPSISSTTTYYVSYTSGGVESTRTAVVATIKAVPVSTFTESASTVALNTNVTFTYTGGDPSTSTYTWNFNGGTTILGTGQGPYTVQWSTPGTKTITLSVTNAAGCTSTVSTQTLAVSPAAPTASGGSNCGTGTVLLTAAGGSPTGGTYNWYAASSGGTALQSSTSTTYTTPSISATTTYYVSYTTGGAESNRTAVTATINPVPVSTFSESTSTVALNTNVTFTYTGGDPITSTYTWNFNGGTTVTGTGQGPYTIQWSTPGTKTVTLSVTNSSGCTSTVSSQSVAVSPAAPTATGGSNCGAGSVTLTAAGTPAGGTYNWYAASTGGTALQSSTSATYSPSIITTKTYYVSYTSGGVESARTAVAATINPIVSSPFSNAAFEYPFNGNANDISGNSNTGHPTYTSPSTTAPTLSADRYGAASSAYTFDGQGQYIYTTTQYINPQVFTLSLWFNTTTTSGGKLIGFDTNQPGPGAGQFDRHIYMNNSGQLYFGVYSSATLTINSTNSYNDGIWHHVVVTFGPTYGSVMYVDGVSVASNAAMTAAETDNGYWRIGGDNLSGWPSTHTSNYFAGQIDDIGVYSMELTAAQVAGANNLNLIGATGPVCAGTPITLYGPDVTGATFTWQDSGGTTMTSQNPTFPSAVAGAYTLTVTGGPGGCSSTATITPNIIAAPSSSFTVTSPVAVGSSSTLTFAGVYNSAYTYTYSFGGGTAVSGSGSGPYAIQWSTPGTKTLSISVTSTAGCSSSSTQTVTVTPAAPTAAAVSVCGSSQQTITAAGGSPTGGTYNWYTTSSGGTALQSSTSATFTTPTIVTATYYVSYTTGGVESTRTAVTATNYPIVSSPYAGAAFSYPFSGNTNDVSGNLNNGVATGAPTLTADRYGATNSAYNFNGSSQYISTTATANNPNVFTISLWFNTTTAGGKLIGLGSSQTGSSGSYDRHLYMTNTGQLYFGIYQGGAVVTVNTTASYNDGIWHHAVVTMGTDGCSLYVDGTAQASNTSMTNGQNFTGYWRIGYDNIGGWTNAPTNSYFTGVLDDIAVYNTEFTSAQVASTNNLNQIGAYSSVCLGSPVTLYAPAITGATYNWTDPSGNTATGQNPTFPAAVAGNYSLTVIGGPGGCSSSATVPVTVNTASATFTATSTVLVGSNAGITYTGTESAASTYTWNFNGGTVISGSGQGPYQVSWSTAGTKTITLSVVSATTGCPGTSTQTVTVSAASGWYSNYVYREKLTIAKSLVSGSTDLNNFPMLIKVVDANLIYTAGSCTNKIQSATFGDIAFTDGSSGQTTELPYQIDTYNATTGTLLVWVKVPNLAASGSASPATVIDMYYGSTAPPVAHTTAFQQTTWNGATSTGVNYNSVYHFNEALTTSPALDGTSNAVNLTPSNTSLITNISTAIIGNGVNFLSTTGNGANLTATGITSYPTNGHAITTSYWFNYPTAPGGATNVTQNGMVLAGSTGGILVQMGFTNGVTEVWPSGGRSTPYVNNSGFPAANTWHYYVYTWDGTKNAGYIDGVAITADTPNPLGQAANPYNQIMFGDYPNDIYSEEFDGSIDEAHVIGVALTPAWVQTEYNNQLNPTNLGTAPFISAIANIEYNNTNYLAGYSPGSLIYTWTGTGGTGVTTASNWNITSITPNVAATAPTGNYSSLNIPAGASSYPQLSAALSVYSLTLASGATFSLNGNTLSVGCNVYNSSGGQILYGGNTASGLTFNGSLASQYYYGSTTAATGQIANLTVNNTASGTVNISGGGLDVYGTLTMTSGNLAVGASPGALTLKSLAGQTANVAAIPTGLSITGNVTAERFVTGGATYNLGKWVYRNYRLMSSPVNEGVDAGGNYPYSLNYLGASTIISDCASTYAASNHGNPSLYLFNEKYTPSNVSYISGNFIGVTDVTSTVASGTISTTDATNSTGKLYAGDGYMMYFRGNNINNLTGTPSKTSAPYVAPENVTFSTTGLLNQGTYSVVSWTGAAGLMYTTSNAGNVHVRGFNLVGNPYPSSIDWSTFSNSSSTAAIYGANVNPSVYIFDPITGNYDTYSATTHLATGKASNVIASGQGFFVQANAASPTLKFNESAKTSAQVSAANSLLGTPNSQGAYNSYLRLKLVTDSLNQNDMLIGFNSTSTPNFNGQEDAEFLSGLNQLQSIMSITKDSIKAAAKWLALPKGTAEDVVKLRVWAQTKGVYTIQRTDLKAIPAIYEIWLMDNLKKDSLDIRNNSSYAFDLDPADTTTFGNNRFTVVIRENQALAFHLLNFTATKATGGSALVWVTENEQNYTNFTVQRSTDGGNTFNVLGGQGSSAIGTYSFTDTNPANGANMYRVMIQDLNGTISYTNVITLTYGGATTAATASNGIVIYPNPAMNTINLSIQQNTQLPSIVHSTNSTLTLGSPATGTATAAYSITITNDIGYVMRTDATTTQSWQADVGNLLPGVYIIQVQDKNTKTLVGKGTFVKL